MLRAVDHDIATGVYLDMTEHGWARDAWPTLFEQVMEADILVIAGPIWLGDNSSITKQVIERLYAGSSMTNAAGSTSTTARSAGAIITGNEDGIKHCSQHPLQPPAHRLHDPAGADAGWIGEAGPVPSYLDPGSGGPENEFTELHYVHDVEPACTSQPLLKRRAASRWAATSAPSGTRAPRLDHENPSTAEARTPSTAGKGPPTSAACVRPGKVTGSGGARPA